MRLNLLSGMLPGHIYHGQDIEKLIMTWKTSIFISWTPS